MLTHVGKLAGIPALIAIVVLGVAGILLAGIPFLRRVAWLAAAAVAVIAALNEFRR